MRKLVSYLAAQHERRRRRRSRGRPGTGCKSLRVGTVRKRVPTGCSQRRGIGMLLILLIVLIVLVFAGGFGYNSGAYRGPGIGVGGILLIILLVLLLTGNLT